MFDDILADEHELFTHIKEDGLDVRISWTHKTVKMIGVDSPDFYDKLKIISRALGKNTPFKFISDNHAVLNPDWCFAFKINKRTYIKNLALNNVKIEDCWFENIKIVV